MAKKQLMKKSECRILVYLSQVPKPWMQLTIISIKLEMDYGYCLRILNGLRIKGWVFKHKVDRRVFYDLTHGAPVEDAKRLLSDTELKGVELATNQTTLEKKNDMEQGQLGKPNTDVQTEAPADEPRPGGT